MNLIDIQTMDPEDYCKIEGIANGTGNTVIDVVNAINLAFYAESHINEHLLFDNFRKDYRKKPLNRRERRAIK